MCPSLPTYERQKIDVNGSLWRFVLACTGPEKYFSVLSR
jgi:hypothetical protein